jgi:AmmeMemoRadiSam system protein B
MDAMVRQPAVSGRFYPADARELTQQVEQFTSGTDTEKITALGCMVPHAGYMYSGHVAGAVFRKLRLPAQILLLGPRHFPRGAPVAILSKGTWRTPLGEARIDSALAAELKHACRSLREDTVAHSSEHSLEVQIPFLQRLAGDFSFVPIVLGTGRFEVFDELGKAVAQVISAQKAPVLVLASSDMNHYESDEITRVKDRLAIEQILALDPRGLFDTVNREEITMCGYGAAVTMLIAVRALGAKRAELIRYATSGDINHSRDQVVGYAGIIIE